MERRERGLVRNEAIVRTDGGRLRGLGCQAGIAQEARKCLTWSAGMGRGRPGLSLQAEPIVTATKFPTGATKVPHGRGGVRRRDAAARNGQGRGRGGDRGGQC